MAGATTLLLTAPPEAPTVDPHEQAIRDRMAAWAARDAQEWDEDQGDLTVPWDEARGHLAIVIDDTGRELELFEKEIPRIMGGVAELKVPLEVETGRGLNWSEAH